MIDIFKFFINTLIESYVLSVLIYGIFSQFWDKNDAFLNKINRIGLVLGILGILHQINNIKLYINPINNYYIDLKSSPFWYHFLVLEIVLFAVAAFIFWKRNRRETWFFTIIGLFFLCLPKVISEINRYFSLLAHHPKFHFTVYIMLFYKNTWWLISSISAIFLIGVFFRVKYLERRK